MNKCIFCNDDVEIPEGADICDECVKRGIKEGWLHSVEEK